MNTSDVKQKNSKSLYSTVRKDEQRVVDVLRRAGIYAMSGRATEFKWIDVVAWGVIPIEVKTATYSELQNGYHFRFTTRHGRGIQGDIVILAIESLDKSHFTFHVFPVNHPVFYVGDKQKQGMSYRPFAKKRRTDISTTVLTPELMAQHKDAWQYIEIRRLELVQELRGAAQTPAIEIAA